MMIQILKTGNVTILKKIMNDLHVLSDHNPTISMVTKGNDVIMEPDLSDSKLQMKHRKHTKYKYSNQPIRFRNANDNIMNYLHLRFGHASDSIIKRMIREDTVKLPDGITYQMIEKVQSTPCRFCELAKSTRIPSQPSEHDKEIGPMVIICSDIIGKFNILSKKPYHYIALFVDYFTGYIMLYFMQQKSNLFQCLQKVFLEHVDYYNHVCRVIRADYDSMYRDSFIRNWLLNKKVKVQFSAPYHHQGNGIAERTVRKLLDLARTLMIESRAPLSATDLYIELAGWWLNRLPNTKTGNKTPYEIITGRKPDLSYCVPASSTAYVLHTKEEPGRNHKMSPTKAYEARLTGYPEGCEGSYRLLTNESKLIVRRDVRFNDFEQPKELSKRDLEVLYNEEEWHKYVHSIEEDKNQFFDEEDELINITIDNKEDLFKIKNNTTSTSLEEIETQEDSNLNVSSFEGNRNETDDFSQTILDTESKIRNECESKESSNQLKKKINNNDFVRVIRSRTKRVNGINYVLKKHEDVRVIVTPRDCMEALSEDNPYRNEWLQAINRETDAMLNIKEETIPAEEAKNKRAFKSRMVFKVKIEPDGSIVFKARLVIKGYLQQYGLDYDETFAPTITFGTILLILHIAATEDWYITGCDIGNAYLEALTNREFFMELPPDYTGFDETGNQNRVVVRLLRNLYGSKQAAYMWYNLITKVLLDYQFIRSQYEPCCFIKRDGTDMIIVCIYVDDLLITGSSERKVEDTKAYLAQTFHKIKDLQSVQKYLGLRMNRSAQGQIQLSQTEYIEDIIAEFKKNNVNIVEKDTPLPRDIESLIQSTGDKLPSMLDIIGKIRFLADRTRPDIAFVSSFLARFGTSPTKEQLNGSYRVIGYLQNTKNLCLNIGSPSKQILLFAMSDASFVRGGDSKSQLSYSLFLSTDSGTFYTKSQKDKTVSLSSFHSEINALVETIKIILYYRDLLKEIGYIQNEPTLIYSDNMSVIQVSETLNKDNRSIYLINKINFIREQISERTIQLQYINTNDNVTDIGTKSLDKIQHRKLTLKLLNGITFTE